jgi:hypothetical protein
MTDDLDLADLAELDRLLAAATPRPWHREGDAIAETDNYEIGVVPYMHDCDLIVAAVNALPALLARVRAAEARADGLADSWKRERAVVGDQAMRLEQAQTSERRLAERIVALEAAGRVLVDEVTGRTVPKGTHLWCTWCDSTPIGTTDPRCEDRDVGQHYAVCPVGALAALLDGDA